MAAAARARPPCIWEHVSVFRRAAPVYLDGVAGARRYGEVAETSLTRQQRERRF